MAALMNGAVSDPFTNVDIESAHGYQNRKSATDETSRPHSQRRPLPNCRSPQMRPERPQMLRVGFDSTLEEPVDGKRSGKLSLCIP